MKTYRISSDWHIEFWGDSPSKCVRLLDRYVLPPSELDPSSTLLMAGDFMPFRYCRMPKTRAILDQIAGRFKQVYMVPGNHEYWHGDISDLPPLEMEYQNIKWSPESPEIIGRTLWTNFRNANPLVMNACRVGMKDCDLIKDGNGELTPDDILYINTQDHIAISMSAAPVVLTHHAPCERSIDPKFKNSPVNDAYYSDYSALIAVNKPKLWVHGHIHAACDYMLYDTRIICNPYGYHAYESQTGYNKNLFVEL